MAHNLSEKDGKTTMFYVGDKPWHNLGTELNEPATAKEAIQAASLDYEVVKEDIRTQSGIKILEKVATVRQDTNQYLNVVGRDYQIIQNVEAFDFFDHVVGQGKAIYHTAGALGKGERVWILAKLPNDIVVANKDNVEKYLLLTNSHDGRTALRMFFTPVRVVCQNTLVMALGNHSEEGVVIRHTGSIKDKLEEATRLLGISQKFYSDLEKQFQLLTDRTLNTSELRHYYNLVVYGNAVVGREETTKSTPIMENRITKMTELFETGKGNNVEGVRGTLWVAMNSVTEYVDHFRSHVDTDDSKLKNVWFGAGARLKQRAFDVATSLVK